MEQYNPQMTQSLLGSHDEVLKSKDEFEKAIEECIQFFKLDHLKINPDKTEFF